MSYAPPGPPSIPTRVAKGSRRHATAPFEQSGQVFLTGEAAGKCNLRNGRVRPGQKSLRTLNSEMQQILMRRHADRSAELAREVAGAQAGSGCNVNDGDRAFKICLHEVDRAVELPSFQLDANLLRGLH